MDKNKLPKTWKITKLGEIVSIVYGKGLAIKDLKPSGFPVFGANGIIGFNDKYLYENPEVLISCRGAYSGKINFSPPKCYVTNNSLILQIANTDSLNKKFLFFALQSVDKSKIITGSAQPQVTINNAVDLTLPLPTVPEQESIVAKIEELFSELDAGIENLKTAQAQLKTYRQAVLKYAFEGKFTNDNVKEGELPEGWEWKKLGDSIIKIQAGKSSKCDERPPEQGETGIVKVSAVSWGEFNEDESKTIFSEKQYNENYLIKKNDFLFSRANTIELVGACVIVKKIAKHLMLSDKTLRFIFNESIKKEYALYYLRSHLGRKEIELLSTGNQDSMRNIGQARIKEIKVPITSITEQQKIVEEIESRLSVCDKLEETIAASLSQSEALRQSILKKAFEGKLVPQEKGETATIPIEGESQMKLFV